MTTVIRQLRSAITSSPELLEPGEKFRPEILYRFVPKIVKPEHFMTTIDTLDIEGLIIKTLEVVDNVMDPPDRPDSVWRDLVEIQTFYAPALELYGFDDVAAYARGVALEETTFDEVALGNARDQYALSQRHFAQIQADLRGAVDATIGEREAHEIAEKAEGREAGGGISGIEVEVDKGRVKMPGSIARKLLKEEYQGKSQVPDGVGFRLLVDWSAAELSRADDDALQSADLDALQKKGAGRLPWLDEEIDMLARNTPNFRSWLGPNHILIGIENTFSNPRKSGYQAIHVQMEYHADNGEVVPYEIQIVNKHSHRREHTYGGATHIFYKQPVVEGTKYEHILAHLDARADVLRHRPNHPELNAYTWSDLIKSFPNLDTSIYRIFGLTTSGESRHLVPREIAGIGQEIVGRQVRDSFLPPSKVAINDFIPALKRLSPELGENEDIDRAFKFAVERHGTATRNDRKTLVIEGHILPSVVHAVMLLKRSGELWERDHREDLVPSIIALILHDVVEDTTTTREEAAKLLEDIKSMFGNKVSEKVKGLSKPDIKDHAERDRLYLEQLKKGKLIYLKLPDRLQNITTDIVRALTGRPIDIDEALAYWQKTKEDFGPEIAAGAYKEVAELIEEFMDLAVEIARSPKRQASTADS